MNLQVEEEEGKKKKRNTVCEASIVLSLMGKDRRKNACEEEIEVNEPTLYLIDPNLGKKKIY